MSPTKGTIRKRGSNIPVPFTETYQTVRVDRDTNRYITKDGYLDWERMSSIIIDVTDKYLSEKQAVVYNPDGNNQLIYRDSPDDTDEIDEVGSRLLSTLSNVHFMTIDFIVHDEDEEEVLYRLEKLLPVLSKLSDKYSMRDSMYSSQYHNDIIDICEAVKTCDISHN